MSKDLGLDASSSITTARQPRVCAGCDGEIPAGARYLRWLSHLDFKVRHECAACASSNGRPIPSEAS